LQEFKSASLYLFFFNRKFYLLFLFFVTNIYSQDLITDRPDQTESAVTVPLNSLQIETGLLYESEIENGIPKDSYSLAGTLLRFGLFERIELRFGAAYLINKSVNLSNNGLGDFLVGAKINFLTEENNSFDFGLLLHAALPLGDENSRPEKTEPEIIASISKSISENISLGINLGGYNNSSIEEVVYLYTAAIGLSFTNNLSAFIEVFGNYYPSFYPEHFYDGGLTYLFTENIQIDISGGSKFSSNNSIWFVSTGLSLRFNNL
jgi:hypothetical protein